MSLRCLGLGHGLLAVSAAGLGILNLIFAHFAPIWEPLPHWLLGAKLWTAGSGVILLMASAGLFLSRLASISALIIGLYECAWALTRLPPLLLHPLTVASWYGFGEALGPVAGTFILYVALSAGHRGRNQPGRPAERWERVAQTLFGAACVAYGAAHLAYASYTAGMVPSWLPGRLPLTYLTGICHIAAGLALIFRVLPRLAATLEAIMMSLFGILVWLPTFFIQPLPEWAAPRRNQWSEAVLTCLLAAAAWIVAASIREGRSSLTPEQARARP